MICVKIFGQNDPDADPEVLAIVGLVDGKVQHVAGNRAISKMVLDRAYLVEYEGEPVSINDEPEWWLEGLAETYAHGSRFWAGSAYDDDAVIGIDKREDIDPS
jgi:hypothetical protein